MPCRLPVPGSHSLPCCPSVPSTCLATISPPLALACSHPPQTALPHSHLCCCSPGLADVLQAWSCWGFCCICPVLPCLVMSSAPLLDQHPFLSLTFKYKRCLVPWGLVFPLEKCLKFFWFCYHLQKPEGSTYGSSID